MAKDIFVAKGADIVGNVSVGDKSSIWYQSVVRGDQAPIRIGSGTNIQDGTVVHVDENHPTIIGDSVTVGHNCTIHGCSVGDHSLIGMGSIILNGARIGRIRSSGPEVWSRRTNRFRTAHSFSESREGRPRSDTGGAREHS